MNPAALKLRMFQPKKGKLSLNAIAFDMRLGGEQFFLFVCLHACSRISWKGQQLSLVKHSKTCLIKQAESSTTLNILSFEMENEEILASFPTHRAYSFYSFLLVYSDLQ